MSLRWKMYLLGGVVAIPLLVIGMALNREDFTWAAVAWVGGVGVTGVMIGLELTKQGNILRHPEIVVLLPQLAEDVLTLSEEAGVPPDDERVQRAEKVHNQLNGKTTG